MPTLCNRILEVWLENAVPSSIQDMTNYQKALAQVDDFASKLNAINWAGEDLLHEWVANAPKIWLSKRRETELDRTRNQLSLGLGTPQFAERFEKRMIAREEGDEIATTGNLVTQDWDAAWESGGDDEPQEISNGTKNKKSLDEERDYSVGPGEDQVDEEADAWGWGDEDSPIEPEEAALSERPIPDRHITPDTREMTLSEKYWTSSLPQPIFKTVVNIFNDGATLKKPEYEQLL